ncbi:hypothetical protein C7H84_26080 [Burkholderia sp. Nafp2/4-1b]|uniref:hypothetical protein n=1 Tax=Burkholderia sp. Nafp2/4-1b TaxID=2116686 RepID=UPI000EF8E606|nr:hypothetical protein [Burkholderia sp. Nafp2/4-1b]RKU00562.1 hypothetical protein C7H84_26080 [Burkholderia sp. Nafp2/4-1b]
MSTAFTDFLLATSHPETLIRFLANREVVMDEYGLSDEEKSDVRNGIASHMRKHAVSLEDGLEARAQFTPERTLQFNPALIEIDPVVEIHITVDQSTVEIPNQIYVAQNGQLFVGMLKGGKNK